ncbi:hypothetical protein L484_023667 [Morus notabilis]|uniref:Uncharacterized protein n=1 Tax=Morus notabilis TaxID=981085 RepID=W9RPC9_9ROSA|nr:hypothetical protein L484_023667 [Morus notabilis]
MEDSCRARRETWASTLSRETHAGEDWTRGVGCVQGNASSEVTRASDARGARRSERKGADFYTDMRDPLHLAWLMGGVALSDWLGLCGSDGLKIWLS